MKKEKKEYKISFKEEDENQNSIQRGSIHRMSLYVFFSIFLNFSLIQEYEKTMIELTQ